MTFRFRTAPLDLPALRASLEDGACGGYTCFEGWVRDHNDGQRVVRLEYEAFEPLAIREGERIVAEAVTRFGVQHAACEHRIGPLAIGEIAVWVGVSAGHRDEAFRACRYIIDEVKHRVPIWKKEHYENGDSGWVNCERCAEHAHEHAHEHTHEHGHEPVGANVPDYSRQMALKEVGAAGQARLRGSSVLVVGCGGLGVPAMTYLAAAGVGRLGLADEDRLEASNLHRQPLYTLADVGRPKVELAARHLRSLNPEVELTLHPVRVDARTAPAIVAPYDLVIDCTDSIASKLVLNDVCVRLGKPVVFASVYQYEGQLQVVRPGHGACLRCVWPEAARDGLVGNCAEAGVLGPVPGTLGTLQALEALKLLLNLPGQLDDELLLLDLLTLSVMRVRARRASDCPDHGRARDATPSSIGATGDTDMEFDSLEAALDAGFDVIDIRERVELTVQPGSGAPIRCVPMGELLYGAAEPLTHKCLLVCATGVRSRAAARELRARGAAEVFSLRGGLAGLARSPSRTTL